MFIASAENVVDITAMPAMPGTITCRLACSSAKIAPNSARNSSGSRKLKNAALGLRQNILRSSRYCRHAACRQGTRRAPARAAPHRLEGVLAQPRPLRGELEVDVLEARLRDAELVHALAARERLAGQLVQQRASGPRSRARARVPSASRHATR